MQDGTHVAWVSSREVECSSEKARTTRCHRTQLTDIASFYRTQPTGIVQLYRTKVAVTVRSPVSVTVHAARPPTVSQPTQLPKRPSSMLVSFGRTVTVVPGAKVASHTGPIPSQLMGLPGGDTPMMRPADPAGLLIWTVSTGAVGTAENVA